MKELGLLPRAKKMSGDGLHDDEKTKNERHKRHMNFFVFLPFFIVFMAMAFISPYVFWFMVAAAVVCAGLFPMGELEKNGIKVANTLWNRLPFLFVGIFIIIIGITMIAETKDDELGDRVLGMLLMPYLLSIAGALFGRAIFLMFKARAVSNRRKKCTLSVLAEMEGSPVEELPSGLKLRLDKEGDLQCTYCYEGETYQFILPERELAGYYEGETAFELLIDPDKPERYYMKDLFEEYGGAIAKLIIWAAVITICALLVK